MHSDFVGRWSFRGTKGNERWLISCKMNSLQSLKVVELIYTKRRRHIQFFHNGDDFLKLHLITARQSFCWFPICIDITFNIVRSVIEKFDIFVSLTDI